MTEPEKFPDLPDGWECIEISSRHYGTPASAVRVILLDENSQPIIGNGKTIVEAVKDAQK